MKSYKLIGLTGATGAGKGEVRAVFEERGYKVIDADLLAREIMKNPIVLESVKTFFGEDTVVKGKLDRGLLAKRAFSSKDNTALLNSVTHPHITPLFLKELKVLADGGADKIIFDAPQLFESGLDIICDAVISVTADERIRLERIKARDNLTDEEAKRRINAQFSDEYFRENSDYTIENNSTPDELRARAEEIIDRL